MLVIISLVIGASIIVSLIIIGSIGLFEETTVLSVSGGKAFIDPSDGETVVGEAIVTVVGPHRVKINSIAVIHYGKEYEVNLLNPYVVNEHYPNSGSDVFSLKFYFKPSTTPSSGDKIDVIITYEVEGEIKIASGTIFID